MCRPTNFLQPAKGIVCFLFCLVVITGFTQPGVAAYDTDLLPGLRTITAIKSFPPGLCDGIVQDATGFIWISTEGQGLFRFDGKNLKQYKNDRANKATIAANAIFQIHEDSRHRLWVFFMDGEFDVFDPLTEKVRHLSAELGVRQKINGLGRGVEGATIPYRCKSLFEDARHRLWVVADTYVAVVDEGGKGSFRLLVNAWAGISPISILSVNETAKGNLLLVTTNEIVEADTANRIVRRTPLPAKAVADATIFRHRNSMNVRKGDTLYAACPAGMILYACTTGSAVLKEGLPPNCVDIKLVVSPSKDRFLFYDTTKANHLYEYITGSTGFNDLGQYQYFKEFGGTFLPYDVIVYLYDRFGNLWHGGWTMRAVYRGRVVKPPFRVVKYKHDNESTDTVYNGQQGNPFFLAEKYAYTIWRSVYEDLLHVPAAILDKLTILTGYPIVGSPDGGAYYIDSAWRFSLCLPAPYYDSHIKGTPRWTVNIRGSGGSFQLYTDNKWRDGKLWVYDKIKHTLFTIDTSGNTTRLDVPLPPLTEIVSFATSGNNTCWMTLSHMAQLALYQPGKGFIKIINRDKGKMPLPDIVPIEIIQDYFNEHVFWITTNTSGMLRFNEEDETWQLLSEKDGFSSGIITGFMQDRRGYFWYSTESGIYRFDSRTNKHQQVVSAEMLSDSAFSFASPMAHLKGADIFWSSGTHAIAIKADSIKEARDVAVALTGLELNNRPVEPGDSSGLLPVALNALPELRLAYDQNFLHFGFTALEYSQPDAVRYRYQLEGIDKAWVEAGSNDDAQYTSLPPGHYIFKVNATNEDGGWSSEVKSIRVVISPPWWRTWWMYVVYALLLIGAVWWFMKTRLRRLQLRQQVILKQKEAEQAHAMEETKSRFFANVTHELRTPLTLILSPVQKQLKEGADTYSPQLLKGVYQNSQTLLRLINQLLDMSKLEGGNMQVTLSRGNLPLFIDGLLSSFRQQAAVRSVELAYQHEATLEEYLFDADKVEKIVYNLLSNAFKFTADGGDITVSIYAVQEADNRLIANISVADSGIGISPEHLPQVFDRFYQVNMSTTRRYEGTGIGLSLVKELAELMGGGVKAESTEGKGSVFTVSLPLTLAGEGDAAPSVQYQTADETLAPGADAPATDVSSEEDKRPVVLVVDDNEGLRRFIAETLAPHYRVLTAVDGEAALETALAELPELIISDVMMPVMDGYEFCQKIKETPLTGHIGFVMLTAKTADDSRLSGLRLGADHYLGKPFNVEELLLVVSNLLKRQQALREHYGKQLQPAEKLPPVNEVEDAFLRQVYGIIETNLDSEKLDVDFLASKLAVSRRTLNRKLSAIAGTSANEIIRHYRLKKAAGLLLSGHGVSDAAYATGFSTPSWFSQCFKEMYGIAPVQYVETGGLSQN